MTVCTPSPLLARSARGFTLIEVMITVAIVAILASIALPSYSNYVRRGKLQEAFAQMATARAKLEQYYQDYRKYGTANGSCLTNASLSGSTKYFTYTCTVGATDQTYVITATGNNDLSGYVYTLDQNNAQATTKFENTTVTKTCWITKAAETCN